MRGEIFKAIIGVLGDDRVGLAHSQEILRRVTIVLLPTFEGYAEACALLDQTLALIDETAYASHEDQQKIADARAFLGGHP